MEIYTEIIFHVENLYMNTDVFRNIKLNKPDINLIKKEIEMGKEKTGGYLKEIKLKIKDLELKSYENFINNIDKSTKINFEVKNNSKILMIKTTNINDIDYIFKQINDTKMNEIAKIEDNNLTNKTKTNFKRKKFRKFKLR